MMADVRYRLFDVRVARAQRLSPSFARITFTGTDLLGFGAGGFDQRIKVILPVPGADLSAMPRGADWYDRWRALPADRRPAVRTYTVRSARPERAEIDVDFVLHGVDNGHSGPAARWAADAQPGDAALLLGPDRPGYGRAWGCEWAPPNAAERLLLAGDETAVPAVCAVLEALPAGTTATALLEVPTTDDALPVTTAADVDLRWLPRDDGEGQDHGERLADAVRATVDAWHTDGVAGAALDEPDGSAVLWDVPEQPGVTENGAYVWLAGEAAVVAELRRHLVTVVGLPRSAVVFMGYWRRGRTEHT